MISIQLQTLAHSEREREDAELRTQHAVRRKRKQEEEEEQHMLETHALGCRFRFTQAN